MTWQQIKLGEIITLNYGKNLPKSARIHGNIGVYGSNGAVDKHNTPITNGKTIIIGRKGSLGQVHLSANSCFPIDTTFFIDKNSTKQDLDWLFFKLKSLPLTTLNNSTSVPGLNRNEAYSLSLRLPPLPEQHKIATILSALNDKIENNRKTAATLEEMARALYRSWFVDFDPVHARAEGHAPAHMNAATAALFPDRFGEDGLPEGWSMGVISNLAHVNPESHSKKHYPKTIKYVDLANTKWGNIENTIIYNCEDAPSRAKMILRKRDTIIGTVRPGNGSYSYIGHDGLTGSTGFAVLRPKNIIDSLFLYIASTDNKNISYLANLADGGAYPAIRPQVVGECPVCIATPKIRKLFAKMTNFYIEAIELKKIESQTLATLRDTLLPRLMSGELRVSAAKEMVEEASS